MEFIRHYLSPLGRITLSSDGASLTGLWFDGQKYYAATPASGYEERSLPVFDRTAEWLDTYFSGSDPGTPPPLAPKGTPFRRAVWDILLTIPYGSTTTYGTIAALLSARDLERRPFQQVLVESREGGRVQPAARQRPLSGDDDVELHGETSGK